MRLFVLIKTLRLRGSLRKFGMEITNQFFSLLRREPIWIAGIWLAKGASGSLGRFGWTTDRTGMRFWLRVVLVHSWNLARLLARGNRKGDGEKFWLEIV